MDAPIPLTADQKVFYNMGANIFTWLSIKTIYRFRSVSKYLTNLPLYNWFCKQHVNNTKQSSDLPSTYLLQKLDGKGKYHPRAISLFKDVGIPNESMEFLSLDNTRVLASSCGLLLCLLKSKYELGLDEALVIFNPITRLKKYIPSPPKYPPDFEDFYTYKVIFECDSNGNDFLLVMIIENMDEDDDDEEWTTSYYDTVIYSTELNDWKEMGTIHNYHYAIFRESMSVCFDGVIYYLSYRESYLTNLPSLIAYDIRKGTSKMLIFLEDLRNCEEAPRLEIFLFRWGRSNIALLKILSDELNLWVLEDFDTNSWKHIFKRSARVMGLDQLPTFMIREVKFVNESTIIIVFHGLIFEYCFREDGRVRNIEKIQDFYSLGKVEFSLFPYSSSLRYV